MARNAGGTGLLTWILLWLLLVAGAVSYGFSRAERLAGSMARERFSIIAMDSVSEIERAIDLGFTLGGLRGATSIIERNRLRDKSVMTIDIFSTHGGQILYTTASGSVGTQASPHWQQLCSNSPATGWFDREPDSAVIGFAIQDSGGEDTGCLTLRYSLDDYRLARTAIADAAARPAALASVAGILFIFSWALFAGIRLVEKHGSKASKAKLASENNPRNRDTEALYSRYAAAENFAEPEKDTAPALRPTRSATRRRIRLIAAFICGLMLPTVAALSLTTAGKMEKALLPIMENKATALAISIRQSLDDAVTNGIPFGYMSGMDAYLEKLRKDHSGITYILITDGAGRVLYEAGYAARAFTADKKRGQVRLIDGYHNVAEQVTHDNKPLGWVQIGFSDRLLRDDS